MNPTREQLRERIEARLTARLAIGMLDEGRKIFEMNLTDSQIKKLGIEYFYMNEYFTLIKDGQENEITLDNPTSLESSPTSSRDFAGHSAGQRMKTEIINKSYQYAKRQMTWNKKYLNNAELVEIK